MRVEPAIERELDGVLAAAGAARGSPTGPRRRAPSRPIPTAADGYARAPGRRARGTRRSTGCASSSTAPTAPRAASRPASSSASAPTSTAIGDEPDGTNINDGCGSTHPSALAAAVRGRRRRPRHRLRRRRRPLRRRRRHRARADGDELLALFATELAARGAGGDTSWSR